ncbi:MAG TPA: alpha-2-macroglobulin family protein, partial [Xylella taiwanensis]
MGGLSFGCNRNQSGQLPESSGKPVVVAKEPVKGFTLVRAYPDQRDGELALVLEFSQPLAGTQAFDTLVRFEQGAGHHDGGWSLSDDAKTLRYPYVEADKHYTVLVSADLLAAAGSRLGKDRKETVYTGELEPVVGFASQGSILPARASRGVPVVSINVPEGDVEFLRVREKALPAFLARYRRGGQRSSWELSNQGDARKRLSELADPVYVTRFVLDGKKNERTLTYLPIQNIRELREPGLYLAVMKPTGSFSDTFETAFFSVSNIGLHTRAYKDKLFVHTASLHSGNPYKQVDLLILDAKGETVLKGVTDDNGNALLNYTLDAGHVLVSRNGSDVSILPFNQPALDLSEFAVAGRENPWFDVFAWSGRDVYRPGETLRISALLRDSDGKPVKPQPVFLRLKQPDGKTFRETKLQPAEQGYLEFSQTIPSDAPTGRWRVEFRTDPGSKEAVQGLAVRVEEFLPERMKLELSSAPRVLRAQQPFTLKADAAYLYGAPAAGNRFTANLAVAVEQHPLDSMPGWFFGDVTLELPRGAKQAIDITLGADGHLVRDLVLPEEAKPVSPMAVVVSGSVYESGGRTVTRSIKRVLWPADALVGVRPLFDATAGADANSMARFELTRVDADGKPQSAKGLKATLVRELRDYHWRYGDGRWDYDFTRRFENKDTRVVDIPAGTTTKLALQVEWGDYRLEVFDPATGLTMRYPFRAGWGWGDDNRGVDARPDKIKLALDKTSYRAGDTLKVTVTPPHPGKGLLLVESDKPLYVQAIDANPGSTFEIPVTADWERHDVYVTALVFRGGSASSNITPARAVGAAYVPMQRKERRVAVGLVVPQQMRPAQPLPVTVSVPELAGQQAHVTISAVDAGILNMTGFPIPDAAAHFFAQRRLGVDAYDIYGRVIESFEGGIGKLKFGGDMALPPLLQAKRPTARSQTVDLFSGAVKLDAKGNAHVQLPVPDFNGTLRVSALVYGDTRYGHRDAETVVRAPILAEASMPRVMAPGDRSTVTLDVQNFTGKQGLFTVKVEGIGPLEMSKASRSVTLGMDGKTTLNFPLRALEGHGVAQVRVRVDGNGFKAERRYDLPVRAAWPQGLRTQTRVLNVLAPINFDSALAKGLMPDSVNARLSVSAVAPIPFASVLQGAFEYPYGCAEQTASKGYAALWLDDATIKSLGIQGVTPVQRRERLEGALGRLASMQTTNGHFSMWGSNGDVNPVLTPYIAGFLLDAKEAGFAVSEAVLQKALNRLSEDLLSGSNMFYGDDRSEARKFAYQTWSGYVLARVNRAPLGTLRTLYDNERGKAGSGLSLVHLGVALSLQGDRKRGEAAIQAGFAKSGGEPPQMFDDYGSAIRDNAL